MTLLQQHAHFGYPSNHRPPACSLASSPSCTHVGLAPLRQQGLARGHLGIIYTQVYLVTYLLSTHMYMLPLSSSVPAPYHSSHLVSLQCPLAMLHHHQVQYRLSREHPPVCAAHRHVQYSTMHMYTRCIFVRTHVQ